MTTTTSTAPSTVSAERASWRTAGWRSATTARRLLLGRPLASRRALPDFVIVGAQRAGTTSLYRYLTEHPGVRWPKLVKGVHWFDVNYDRDVSWYRSHFPLDRTLDTSDRVAVTGEASPYYLFHPAVPARLATQVPDVRVIIVLRDPLARALSHFEHERARGFEPLGLDDALAAERSRLAGEERRLKDPAYRSFSHQHHSYVSRGIYAPQLRRYLAEFPAEQLLVLDAADLLDRTQEAFDRVCSFLGIAPHTLQAPRRYNARPRPEPPDDRRRALADRFVEDGMELAALLGRRPSWIRSAGPR